MAIVADEASEIEVTDVVNEAAEVVSPGKSLLRTSESSRFLNSIYFDVLQNFFCRIIKYYVEPYHLFCWRLLRPADLIFFLIG